MPNANPVLLYHLRQLVRNRVITTLMLLYLAAMTMFLFTALAAQATGAGSLTSLPFSSWFNFQYSSNIATATALFLLTFYYTFTTVAMVVFAATHTAGDRLQEHPIFFSPLSPCRLVAGKLQFGFVMSFLFLTMTLPFLTVTFLMRGVDLRVILWTILTYFCLTQLQYFITVMFCAGVTTILRLVLFALPWGFCQFLLSIFGLFFANALGIEIVNRNDSGLAIVLTVLFFSFMFTAGTLSLVQFSPVSANRMVPVRILLAVFHLGFLTVLWIGTVYCGSAGHSVQYFVQIIDSGHAFLCFLFPYMFLIFICERDSWSPRILRTIPRSLAGRLFTFPFYTGAANAVVFCLLTFIFELAYIGSTGMIGSSRDYCFRMNLNALSAGLLFFDYCATVLLLYNRVLYRYYSRQWNWVPIFAVFASLAFGFFVLIFLVEFMGLHAGRSIIYELENLWFLPNPVPFNDTGFIGKQLTLAVIWLIVLTIAGIGSWIACQWRQFERPDDGKEFAE